jgi:hypothetical protein
MTEREMLEFAAKAAGIVVGVDARFIGDHPQLWFHSDSRKHPMCRKPNRPGNVPWNPRDDDGDALRLAVKLELTEVWFDKSTGRPEVVCGKHGTGICVEPLRDDPCAATRRAITRAAAEIGKAMP